MDTPRKRILLGVALVMLDGLADGLIPEEDVRETAETARKMLKLYCILVKDQA